MSGKVTPSSASMASAYRSRRLTFFRRYSAVVLFESVSVRRRFLQLRRSLRAPGDILVARWQQ
eukprot:8310648-Prorocentrum_lima.AAC.1